MPIRVIHLQLQARETPADSPDQQPHHDLSVVSGLGKARIARLEAAGMTSVEALVDVELAKLAKIIGVSETRAANILEQARSHL